VFGSLGDATRLNVAPTTSISEVPGIGKIA
jgi:hypothetical protein